jgi:nucleoside recognition membrane protein YjiH
MSITSGYPTGARLTALFRKQKRITAEEAQRVLSFCSTSGPLFMMGAVAIGMMGSPEGGTIILASHYIAAILIGLAFRFYHSRDAKRE